MLGAYVDNDMCQQLKTYVEAHRRHSKGRIIYNGSVFGIKNQSVRDRFSTYHATFGLLQNSSFHKQENGG